MVTGFLHQLCQDEAAMWRFKTVRIGGEPVPKMLIDISKDRCERFVNGYGSSKIPAIAYKVIGNEREYKDYEVGKP